MSDLVLIGLMAGIVYALRIFGLFTARLEIPDLLERALGFAPVAILSALVVSSLAGQGSEDPSRYIAAAGAGLIAFLTKRLWACILGGFALYWLIRLIGGW